jgi:hypothetical protein
MRVPRHQRYTEGEAAYNAYLQKGTITAGAEALGWSRGKFFMRLHWWLDASELGFGKPRKFKNPPMRYSGPSGIFYAHYRSKKKKWEGEKLRDLIERERERNKPRWEAFYAQREAEARARSETSQRPRQEV